MDKRRLKKTFLLALKIAIGSSAAIYLAESLHLQYAASAGGIALLTLVTTKRETVRLSFARIVTFGLSALLGYLIFLHLSSEWVAYGLYMFVIVLMSESLGWKATISVNAVIGTHFLAAGSFGAQLIFNEFLLVCIGIMMAILLNLFHDNRSQREHIIENMRDTERQQQLILRGVAAYLRNEDMQRSIWDDIRELENKLKTYIMYAFEYQENTFQSHAGYYVDYFQMRALQVHILRNLHYGLKKIRTIPAQAEIVADYILYLTDHVVEVSVPTPQLERLHQLVKKMGEEQWMMTREEFQSHAMLFHILLDLEDYLKAKKKFVEGLDETQLKMYCNRT